MMEYLHTMVRISNLEQSLRFYCDLLGLTEASRQDNEKDRYTLGLSRRPRQYTIGARQQIAAARTDLQLGRERITAAAAILAIWRIASTISTRCASVWQTAAPPSIDRRAMVIWRSYAPRTISRSSYCKKATRCHRKSRGYRCRTPASGKQKAHSKN